LGLQEKLSAGGVNLAIRPVAGRIGAELSGLTLGGDLDNQTVAAIREALLKYKVIFFRGQHHMTFAVQEAFSALLGKLVPHPTLPRAEGTEVALDLVFNDAAMAANEWHTDDCYVDAYAAFGILHALIIPPLGGDTMWANTATAYQYLPEPLRDLAGKIRVLHTNSFDSEDAAKNRADAPPAVFEVEHPVVRVHPETGERSMILGYWAKKILGVSREDSARLMGIFQDHIVRPENTVRWHWAPGDVAVWDNRATQHYGIGDFTERRQLHRVSVEGDIPVGIDGRRSVMRHKG